MTQLNSPNLAMRFGVSLFYGGLYGGLPLVNSDAIWGLAVFTQITPPIHRPVGMVSWFWKPGKRA